MSPLTGCQVTTRPHERIARYSKWLDTFRTALVFVWRYGTYIVKPNSIFELPYFSNQTVQLDLSSTCKGNSNEQGPSGENISLPSEEIPHVLSILNTYYCYENCQPLVHILSQMSIVRHPYHIYVLILSSHLRLCRTSGLFPSDIPTETHYSFLLSPIRATYPLPSHLSFFDHPNRIFCGIRTMKLIIT